MKSYCIVNKRSAAWNKELKRVQRKSRRYYQGKLFQKAGNAPKARIGKFCDLSRIEYKIISDIEFQGMKKVKLSKEELIHLCEKSALTGREEAGRCIGCGACTYGCVAGKDVREVVAWAKEKLS